MDFSKQTDLKNSAIGIVIKLYKDKMDVALSVKPYLSSELEQLHYNLCSELFDTLNDTLGIHEKFPWLQRILGLHYEMYAHRNRVKLTVLQEHDDKLVGEAVDVFVKVFGANKRRYAKAVCFEHMSYEEAFSDLKSQALDAAVKHYKQMCNFPHQEITKLIDQRFAEFNGQFRAACHGIQDGAKTNAVDIVGGIKRRNAVVRKGRRAPFCRSTSDLQSVGGTDDSGYVDMSDQRLSDDDYDGSARNSPSNTTAPQPHLLTIDEEIQLRKQLHQLMNAKLGDEQDDQFYPFDATAAVRRSAGPSSRPKRFLQSTKIRSFSTSEFPSSLLTTKEDVEDNFQHVRSPSNTSEELELYFQRQMSMSSLMSSSSVDLVEKFNHSVNVNEGDNGMGGDEASGNESNEVNEPKTSSQEPIVAPPIPKPRKKLQRQSGVDIGDLNGTNDLEKHPSASEELSLSGQERPRGGTTMPAAIIDEKGTRWMNKENLIVAFGSSEVYVRYPSPDFDFAVTVLEPLVNLEDETVPIFPILNEIEVSFQSSLSPEEVVAEFLKSIVDNFGSSTENTIILYPANWSLFQLRRLRLAARFAGIAKLHFLSTSSVAAANLCKANSKEIIVLHYTHTDFHLSVMRKCEGHLKILSSKGRKQLSYPGRFLSSHREVVEAGESTGRKSSRHYDEIFLKALTDAGTHVGRIDQACVILPDDLNHMQDTVKNTLNYQDVTFISELDLMNCEGSYEVEELVDDFDICYDGCTLGNFKISRGDVESNSINGILCTVAVDQVKGGVNQVVIKCKSDEEVHEFHAEENHQAPFRIVVKFVPILLYRVSVFDANDNRIATKNVTFPNLGSLSVLSMSKQTFL